MISPVIQVMKVNRNVVSVRVFCCFSLGLMLFQSGSYVVSVWVFRLLLFSLGLLLFQSGYLLFSLGLLLFQSGSFVVQSGSSVVQSWSSVVVIISW